MISEIRELVIEALQEFFRQHNESESILNDMVIFGKNGRLDSLDFVSLVVNIEEKIYNRYKKSITIVNERAFSKKHNPFATIDSMASYIYELLSE